MSEKPLQAARIVSSVAATCIALACGTNYAFSNWGPQFADRLKLSSTQINLIGLFGNLGMYACGIPIGLLVDGKGPRPAVLLGTILLAAGYFPLYQAYDRGSGWLPLLCLYSFFTGLGGCAANAAAIKTSALNWPHNRGTATAFPLATFGLSAFFFSAFTAFTFPGDAGHFLLVLACGTSGTVFLGFFFLRVIPHTHYSALPGHNRSDSNRLHRTKSEDSRRAERDVVEGEPGMLSPSVASSGKHHILNHHVIEAEVPENGVTSDTDETSSLMSKSTDEESRKNVDETDKKDHAHRVDIRGLQLFKTVEFWQLFALMGILTGIGLMTINNIGNDAQALWRHWDDSIPEEFIMHRQAMHVSILSVCSFTGRLLSGTQPPLFHKFSFSNASVGVGSDFLVKVLRCSGLWCLTLASLIFFVAQIAALNTENPHLLFLVSSFTGLGYGFLFGCFPSLVAEAFGVHGLSTNWGFMTLSPVLSGYIFNLFYGVVYDQHSIVKDGGVRECTEGLQCYRSAYLVTVAASVLGLLVSLWCIRYTHLERLEEARKIEADERVE
ncbi:putative major facilitator superfamily transporter protein [Botrytis cinerea BcDW1]|uniref:Putative major facilitator superfamily transporter protein n=1 Tax=Botryotinia fuckeliana (strain BcDW1) TaxID=1290391 RepID=M7TEY8_BOTF1|nr:putative major facilitator superfamily transporter protein [Botrytis cinerea BcDW1]